MKLSIAWNPCQIRIHALLWKKSECRMFATNAIIWKWRWTSVTLGWSRFFDKETVRSSRRHQKIGELRHVKLFEIKSDSRSWSWSWSTQWITVNDKYDLCQNRPSSQRRIPWDPKSTSNWRIRFYLIRMYGRIRISFWLLKKSDTESEKRARIICILYKKVTKYT